MFRFIKYFVYEWRNYPWHKAWCDDYKNREPDTFRKMEQSDLKRGIKPYKNRFDFAFRNAKIKTLHCDVYGRKCRKFGGNCDICNSKKKGR